MNQTLSRARLEKILDACASLRIAVLGDFALDAYWYIDMERAQLSREAPLFNRPVVKENYSLGGAANVAWNLSDLGIKNIRAISVLGEDWRAGLLKDLMDKAGIQSEACITTSGWSTVLFAKIFLTSSGLQQEDSRIDFFNTNPLDPVCESTLIKALEACLPELDALVISDYLSVGVISARMLEQLNTLAERHPGTLFVVDSRERINQYHNMVLKPNQHELLHAVHPPEAINQVGDEQVVNAGKLLQAKAIKPVFVTQGERGCLVITGESIEQIPALAVSSPIDTVGAGDTFLAALTASLAAGASHVEAASFACLASAVTIRKLNMTGTSTPEEILALYDAQKHECSDGRKL